VDLRIEFTLTPAEAGTALRQLLGPRLRRLVVLVWLILGALFGALLLLATLSIRPASQLVEVAISLLLAWVMALPAVLFLIPRVHANRMPPVFGEPTALTLTRDSFSVARPSFSGTGSWRYFRGWRETPSCFGLFHAPNVVLVVPKRALDPDQTAALRSLLEEKLGVGGG
jgi:hypothetical protein